MRITDCHLYEYGLRLKQPIGAADTPVSVRVGLLIKITNDAGISAWGEAAPLPGFSVESLDAAKLQLQDALPDLIGRRIPPEFEQLELCASARCAIEMALMGLVKEKRTTLTIPVNGLVSATDSQAAARAGEFIMRGFKTVKLKVGRKDVTADIGRVRAVSKAIEAKGSLRLDANRAWSLEDALEFARGLDGCNIEYVEEPLKDTAQLLRFTKEAGLPLALDETLSEIEPSDLDKLAPVAAVILKPTLLGGFERAAAFARAASAVGTKAVVTSTFESPIGIAALANFAAAFGSKNVAAGLETVDWFDEQLLTTPISLERGEINLSQAADAAQTVDNSLLRELAMKRSSHG